ncbi:MAG: SpoIIE family protein phosphatase [Phycisphaerales bacterium]|nr:SpoIIE family protein phosphatase [Phycisphaerales bacterium]
MKAQAYERVLEAARRLAGSPDLHDVLTVIIDALRDVLHADRASVFQYDMAQDEFYATRAHGLPGDLRLPANRGLIGEAARLRTSINVADASKDARFDPTISQRSGFVTGALLTLPLIDEAGALVGVAQVLHEAGNGRTFSDEDEEVARHLTDQAAMALRRATLLEAARRRDELEAELRIARLIQQSSLPKALPVLPGWSLAAHSAPATEAAGDAYDAIHAHGKLWLFMADAAGHGVGPALSVSQVLAMMRMGVYLGAPLEDVARHVNRQCAIDLPHGRFVTAFMGTIEPTTGSVTFVAAGQAPILIRRADGTFDSLCANAPPLGVDAELELEGPNTSQLSAADALLLISDGIFDARPAGGKALRANGVASALANAPTSADAMCASIVRVANTHRAGAPAEDDQTVLIAVRS